MLFLKICFTFVRRLFLHLKEAKNCICSKKINVGPGVGHAVPGSF